MKRKQTIILVGFLSLFLGGISGAALWCILKLMKLGINTLWVYIPQSAGLTNSLVYSIGICMLGGLLIGLMQKKYGIFPDTMDQVMEKIKTHGKYPYDKIHIIIIMALLPLIFGGTIGPEAGLSGVIAGMCAWVGDRLKQKGDMLAAMSEAGVAATLGVIFGAPLFGIVGNLEPDNKKETYRKKLLSKKGRIFIYCMGVLGGFLTLIILSNIFGGSGGLPRFTREYPIGFDQWKWFIPLLAAGVLSAIIYMMVNKFTLLIGNKLQNYRIISCVIAGLILGIIGHFISAGMFSGEDQMHQLINEWTTYSAGMLLIVGLTKIFMVNICVNLGWRGGNIFPMIFSGVAIGYSFALAVHMTNTVAVLDGGFAVAAIVSSMCGYIMRKPLMVTAILLLCFPLTYIAPILICAFAASKIPLIPILVSNNIKENQTDTQDSPV